MTNTGWTPRKALKLHGVEFRVRFVNAKTDADLEHGNLDGRYLPSRRLFKISRKANEDDRREALLHEVLHAADQATTDQELDETTILRLSRFLYGTFRDNPGLASWIAGDSDP